MSTQTRFITDTKAQQLPCIETLVKYLGDYTEKDQWCVWRHEPDRKNPNRMTKPPRKNRHQFAQSDNPATWLSLERACAVADADCMDGIGLMLHGDLLGCDLDACCDAATGRPEPWAREIVDRLDSYTEISPSGCGVKVLFRGDIGGLKGVSVQWGPGVELPEGTVKKHEIALEGGPQSARFFTITGRVHHHMAVRVVNPEDVAWLRQKIEDVRKRVRDSSKGSAETSLMGALALREAVTIPGIETLSNGLLSALAASPKGEDLSADFHRIVTWCKSDGLSLAETIELIGGYPQHIPRRYADRLGTEVQRCYEKGHDLELDRARTLNVQTDDELDAALVAMKLPEIDDEAFYGPLAGIVEKATEKTEATRVGVAIHLISSIAAYYGRPFFVHIGDEDVGLNVFAVQVGPSALARKGTSAALADKRIMPALNRFATELSEQINEANETERAELAAKQALAAKMDELRMSKDTLLRLTEDDFGALELELAELRDNSTIDYNQQRLASLKDKLKDPTLAPRTVKVYRRDIEEVVSRINDQERIESDLVQRIQATRQALDDPSAALAEINRALAQTKEQLLQPMTRHQAPVWMEVLAQQAGVPVILTSLSSGEGLVHSIRDDREVINQEGQTVMEQGVPQKRLFINVSEFGGPLAVMRRQGSTLSEKIRQAYDGTPLSTPSKGDPWSVAFHHICLSGAITPAELAGLLFDKQDTAANADNGVGNRPMFLYVRRTKLVPRPEPTDDVGEIADLLWRNILNVYASLQPQGVHHSVEFPFTEDGAAEWDRCYSELDALRGCSEQASKLHGRITTNARKLAPILALIAGEPFVNAGCVRAAIAWARFASATVDVVASTLKDRVKHHTVTEHAEKVWRAVKEAVEESNGALPTTREIQRVTHLNRNQLLAAVDWLQAQAPALITVTHQQGRNGKAVTYLSSQGEWR